VLDAASYRHSSFAGLSAPGASVRSVRFQPDPGIFFWNLRVRAASVVSHFSSRSMPFLKTSTSGAGTTDQSVVCFPQSGRRPS
jgi:hypothetical protein